MLDVDREGEENWDEDEDSVDEDQLDIRIQEQGDGTRDQPFKISQTSDRDESGSILD